MRKLYDFDTEFPKGTVQSTFPVLFKQEKPWSDYMCCLRTLLRKAGCEVVSEDQMIYEASVPPAHLTSEIMKREDILRKYNTVNIKYGADDEDRKVMDRLKNVHNYMTAGYGVMVRIDHGGGQWVILLGYYDLGPTARDKKVVFYNPYYNTIVTLDGEEFQACWFMEQTEIKWCHDYVAIKVKK
jgi:hypothetical protein